MQNETKAALVTGASGDIGRALCLKMAEAGFDVVAHCFKNENACLELCKIIESQFARRAVCVKANLVDIEETKLLAKKALDFSKIEVLINNAGIAHRELFQFVSDEKAHEIFTVNAESAILLAKEIAPSMISRHSGRIINISSMWGTTGGSCEVHYSASKAALVGFTKALAKELGPSGITVNCIAPGLIDTKMNGELDEEALNAVIDETPLSRIGTPEDVAELAGFLASEKASFITGQIIGVDGGLAV